ncbi:transient receptor potential cation channel subfamily M member-like 2 isoform X2 [Ruditapes philippinarum]|uniref:transient receptor potential cation channel subfamily M member-like 2 isoform X2 n=1 Tax=Ruditapes philippinarum TaxID=129788 RepID=UPI00295BDF81|nr:transient receptor potential cation channel subfamily M member-like 2 isoform X2 [Ruditapes philippinarum]
MSFGYTVTPKIHPTHLSPRQSTLSVGTVETIPVHELDIPSASREYRNVDLNKQKRQDSVRSFQTLQEVRWSSMRKKIPGMSAVPKHLATSPESYDLQTQELRQYVRQHFHMLECSCFIPAPTQIPKIKYIKQLRCHCGGTFTEHAGMTNKNANQMLEQYIVHKEFQRIINRRKLDDPIPVRLPQVQWSRDNLRKKVTNSFGKIKFVNVEHVGGTKPAKYIRMAADDSVEDLFELMITYWRIKEPQPPNLVISVVGGAKNFKLDGRMRTTFSAGLVKAAKTTSAWLISSGFNMGVMKSVGQAVNEGQSFCWDNNRMAHVLRCIGIAPWGYVRDRMNLIEAENGEGKFCAEYRTSNVILHNEPVPLNADHTHFIFVDDGFRNKYGGVAAMRSKIEQKISQPESAGGLGIPVVLIVVEGGTDALADAKSSLEHRIPVVVCAGTGRAADILSYAYSHTKTTSAGVREMSEKHQAKLKDKIFEAYGKAWKEEEIDSKTDAIKDNVKICCQNADLMIIFNMNKAEDLDMAILSVLLKAHAGGDENQRLTQLKLALTWDRVDIAQEEIFREDVLWRQGSLDDILTEAIVTDKVKFMELILQQGVIMKEYLTLDRLEQLYLLVPKHHQINKLMFKLTGKTDMKRQNVVSLLSNLLDRYDDEQQMDLMNNDMFEEEDEDSKTTKFMFARPYKHLLIYAVLLHRQSLAKFCWEMGDEPVTTAVAVTRLYSAMIRHITRDESILRDTIIGYKREFEMMAVNVLNECQQKDPSKAMMIVERHSPVWNEMTCLQIAAASNDRVFLSSETCMDSVSTTWKQGMTSGWKCVFLAILCPPLIPFIIEFVQIGRESMSWNQKILGFYTAPLVKFVNYTLMYLVFVALYTYMLLVDIQPKPVTTIEIICVVWIFTFIIDNIHTLIFFPAPTFQSKMRDFYGIMHYMDWFTFITTMIGFILHYMGFYNACKILYCINAVIFYVGIMQSYRAFENLGPKLVMIKGMFGELRLFIMVLLIFLLAYGIAHQGLMYHDRSPSWTILKDVLYYPYWQLYGELFLEEIETDSCKPGSLDCRTSHWLVPIILAAYLLVGNILLLNLLIAIFSNVFQQIEKNSKEIWKYHMYFLVMEYDKKPFLVAPFSIIPIFFHAIRWLFRKCCCKRYITRQKLGRRHLEYLQLFEKEMMTNYLRRAKASEHENLEMTVKNLEKRVDELTRLIEDEVIGDHMPDPMNFVVADDGQSFLWKRGESMTESFMQQTWPVVSDVLAVKDMVANTEIPQQYMRPMMRSIGLFTKKKGLRSGSGLFVLPAKMPANLVASTDSKGDNVSKDTETVTMETSENKLVGDTDNVPNVNIEEKKESKTKTESLEATTGKVTAEVNQGVESATDTLTEKEIKKLEKAKRKEERRKRKEEKKAKREKSKEREGEQSRDTDNVNDPKSDNVVINDVNQPQKTNGSTKSRVSFHLEDAIVKPGGDRDIRPKTAPLNARSPEIANQFELLERNGTQNMDDQWNIEAEKLETSSSRRAWTPHQGRVSDSEEEIQERKITRKRFSKDFGGYSSSDEAMSLRDKLHNRMKKKKSKKSRLFIEDSDM